MRSFFSLLPILFLLIISGFVLVYIIEGKQPNKPPSALINKPVPNVEYVNLYDNSLLTNKSFDNNFIIINFFASWCAPCKIEHPLLFRIKSDFPNVFLLGINHKDNKNEAIKYLNDLGDPYNFIGLDNEGKLAIEFGVIGLPETFVVNAEGKIIYKHLGPIEDKIYNEIKSLLQ
mgnify:FL=1